MANNVDFENTVLVVGDAELLDQFITRRVTDFSDDIIKSIGKYAFYFCTNLYSLDLPNLISAGVFSFGNCSSLKIVNLPSITSIGDNAFELDVELEEIFLPNAKSLGYNAFKGCIKLRKVDVYMCDKVDGNCFIDCSRFDTLIIRREDKVCRLVNKTAFSNTLVSDGGTGYIYVPRSIIDTYKADSKWAELANQIRAIEDYPEICGGTTEEEIPEETPTEPGTEETTPTEGEETTEPTTSEEETV